MFGLDLLHLWCATGDPLRLLRFRGSFAMHSTKLGTFHCTILTGSPFTGNTFATHFVDPWFFHTGFAGWVIYLRLELDNFISQTLKFGEDLFNLIVHCKFYLCFKSSVVDLG